MPKSIVSIEKFDIYFKNYFELYCDAVVPKEVIKLISCPVSEQYRKKIVKKYK